MTPENAKAEFINEVKTHWASLTPSQRKLAVFLPCLLVALFLATHPAKQLRQSVMRTITRHPGRPGRRQEAGPYERPPMQAAQPSAYMLPEAPAASSPPDQVRKLLGKWESNQAALEKRGLCSLWLEVRRNPDAPGAYTGAATLSCMRTPLLGAKPKADVSPLMAIARLNPLSALLSGHAEKGGITFAIDKLLNAGDCPWSGFSITRFGSEDLAAEWQDACGGAQMVLRKTQ